MRNLTNAELHVALEDPWAFCLGEIRRRHISSNEMAQGTGLSRSGLRALYNGGSTEPSYTALLKILKYVLDTRKTAPTPLPEHRNGPHIPGL